MHFRFFSDGEGGISINDLHPFQGCPFGQLGYFSTLLESMTLSVSVFSCCASATAELIIANPT